MAGIRTDLELVGLERFGHLEDKIYRFAEAFKALRKENMTLKEEARQLRDELERFRQIDSDRQESTVQLLRERDELRDRVEKTLALLAALEDQ